MEGLSPYARTVQSQCVSVLRPGPPRGLGNKGRESRRPARQIGNFGESWTSIRPGPGETSFVKLSAEPLRESETSEEKGKSSSRDGPNDMNQNATRRPRFSPSFAARGAVSGFPVLLSHPKPELSPSKVRSKRRFRVPRGAGAAASVRFHQSSKLLEALHFNSERVPLRASGKPGEGGERHLVQRGVVAWGAARDVHDFFMM